MIKDAIANIAKRPAPETFQAVSLRTEIPSRSFHRILKLLFASDVSLRCLDRSVAKQKLNLFEFASTTMAEPGASATKIVAWQIFNADPAGRTFDRIAHCVSRSQRARANSMSAGSKRIGRVLSRNPG
jgi:hypothetical protein